jgi:hypothetical protein
VRYLQTYKLFETTFINSIIEDIKDICLELSDESDVEVRRDSFNNIKIKEEPDFSGEVLLVDIEKLKITPTLFETLERISIYCHQNQMNVRFAEMYLPFEKFHNFMLRLNARNSIGAITIIIYK